MKKIQQWLRENGRFLLLMSGITLLVLYQFIFLGKDPFFANDSTFQYHLFYEEWIRLLKDFIKHREFPFYSLYSFLGTDFWASKSYYCAFDIFLPFLLLFRNVRRGLVFELFLVIVLSGFNFRYYLKKMKVKDPLLLDVMGIVYGLSGIASMYFGNPMYHRFYAFLPLLFAGVEDYLREKKHTLFILMVFVLFLQNYYFMYPTSFFMIGYFIASSYAKKKESIWKVLGNALPLIGYYLIGLCMSMVVILPTGLYMLKNSRVGQGFTGILFEFKSYVGLLFSYLIPPFNIFTEIPFLFYGGSNSHYHWYSLYISCLGALPLVTALFRRKTEEEKPFLLCYLIYFVILCIKPLNSVVHLFSGESFRWVFVLDFLNLYLLAYLFDQKEYEGKGVLKSYGTYLLVAFVLLGAAQAIGQVDLAGNILHVIALICGAVLSVLYLFLLQKGKEKAVLLVMIAEMIFSSMLTTYVTSGAFLNYYEILNKDQLEYNIQQDDSNLFRMYFNSADFVPTSILNLNQSLHYRYLPTSTYDSAYESSLNPFLEDLGIDTTLPVLELNRIDILKMLGVKYYAIIDGESLPEYEPGFTYAYDINHFHIYRLNDAYALGHTYSNFISRSEFEKTKTVDYLNQLILEDDVYEAMKDITPQEKVQLNIWGHSNNAIDANITVDAPCVLFTAVPYSEGWKITDNGNACETFEADGGFLAVRLEAGEHQLHYQYTTVGFKAGALFSVVGAILFLGSIYLEKRKKKLVKEG